MTGYLVRRLLLGLLTVFFISVVSFAIIELPPGDYVTTLLTKLEEGGSASGQAEADHLREIYGLNNPGHERYVKWMSRVVIGDFGFSLDQQRPVSDVIGDRLWITAAISVSSIFLTWMIALPIGIYSAVRRYSVLDYVFTVIGFLGLAVPSFLVALIGLYLGLIFFGVNLGGLFSAEYQDAPWTLAKLGNLLEHLPLPALILGLTGTAQLIRIMRANLLDELSKPYVTTARAKGLSERDAILKYPVRLALNPFASTIGFLFPQIVSGSIIISVVLSLPTLGPVLLHALLAQDMYLAGTIVLLLGVMTVIGMLVSDLVLMWLDPRVRLET